MQKSPVEKISWFFTLTFSAFADSTWTPSLVSNYFSTKNVLFVDAIVCKNGGAILLNHFNGPNGFSVFFRTVSDLNDVRVVDDVHSGIFIDASCIDYENLIKSLDTDDGEKWFSTAFSWLIWDPDAFIFESNSTLPISTFSDVVLMNSKKFWRIYKTLGHPMLKVAVGEWDLATGVVNLRHQHPRIDFQRSCVKAAIMFIQDVYTRHNVTLQLQDKTFHPDVDVSNRFTFCNALHIAYLFNFTLDVIVATSWGDRFENGTWTGMIGLVQSGEADIALSPMLPLSRRMDVSYPTVPNLPYWMAVIFKQQRALGTYKAMIIELSPSAWACFSALIFIGTMVFLITQKRINNFSPDHSQQSADEPLDSSLSIYFLNTVGVISNQGLSLMPMSTSSRIVCLALLTVGLLISTYYNAATMTALLSEAPPMIKSIEQLVTSPLQFSALNAPYVHNKKARSRVFQDVVARRMDHNLNVCGVEDGIQRVQNGSAVLGEYFTLFEGINSQMKSDEICDLTTFNAGFNTHTIGYTKKCPHFREMFIRGTLRTMEHGLMQKERMRWIAGKPVCSRVTQFIYVQMEAVSVAFGVFLFGFIVSFIMYVVEIILARRHRKKELNNIFEFFE